MKNLTYLLSCYFHQDWDVHGPTWQHTVDAFLTEDPATVRSVPREIDEVLATTPDSELEDLLDDLGSYYAPTEGHRAWLEAVRDRITNAPAGG